MTDPSRLRPEPGPEPVPQSGSRPGAIVFCELLDNESFCASVVRELSACYDVRPCGPGWPVSDLADVDLEGAAVYLELDAASGNFPRPSGLEQLGLPKLAWLIDSHKKPGFHQRVAQDMDHVCFAMQGWAHVFADARAASWLPLHADQELFFPVDRERDLDVVFVGSQLWRADALEEIARRHGLRTVVTTTTGSHEKSQTAALYARTKLVFNRHVTRDLNFRVFEALACGRALVSDAQDNGQYELFRPGEHLELYTDDDHLERLILELLEDDARRERLEQAARAVAAQHSTRARVAQLAQVARGLVQERERLRTASRKLSAWVSGRGQPDGGADPDRAEPGSSDSRFAPRRWLLVSGGPAATVSERSYAQQLADRLQAARAELEVVEYEAEPGPGPGADASTWASWTVGPPACPSPDGTGLTRLHDQLASLTPHQAALHRLETEQGPFDAVLADGPWAGLLAVSLGTSAPTVLALADCEVRRRGNNLTRAQLYRAELEHWLCERVAAVVAPQADVVSALAEHYRADPLLLEPLTTPIAAGSALATQEDGDRLWRRLSPDRFSALAHRHLILAPSCMQGVQALPPLLSGHGALVLSRGAWLVTGTKDEPTEVAREVPTGVVLQALLRGAARVDAVDPADPRLPDACALNDEVYVAGSRATSPGRSLLDPWEDVWRRLARHPAEQGRRPFARVGAA